MIPGNQEPVIGIVSDPEAVNSTFEVYWKNEAMPEEFNNTVLGKIRHSQVIDFKHHGRALLRYFSKG